MIKIVEITKSNWQECVALSVSPEQAKFVATNVYSLAESKFETEMYPIGFCENNKLIGFAMYGYDSKLNNSWIIRFMIDFSYQRKGYGKDSLNELIKLLNSKYKQSNIRLCVEPENNNAIKFYVKSGFQNTNEIFHEQFIFERKSK